MNLTHDGFALIAGVLTTHECDLLVNQLIGSSGAVRNLLEQSWAQKLASKLRDHNTLAHMFSSLVAIQCTYFEKSPTRNWLVPIHQDLSVPVLEPVVHPDLAGWSEKEGSLFLQAPLMLLEQLLALRVHLDACTVDDGPLRLVPGSHRQGKMSTQAAVAARLATPEFVCCAARGSVLVMRPLLLHASSKTKRRSQRRVLHFLFAPAKPPLGLRWKNAV
jgi:ectoine hydroxylase-related dioxygenase (phytanoyl-CoA dioxygenase family)